MELRTKVIHLEPDRHWKSHYHLLDKLEGDYRVQVLYCEDDKAKTRTVEAMNYAGDGEGYDCDVWASDVELIVEQYLPPKITFNQFVGKLALALELVPPDYDIGAAIHPDDLPDEDDVKHEPAAWDGPTLRRIVAALPELKH